MAKILYIKANPKPTGSSYTFRLSEPFVETYQENNPGDHVETLDLYDAEIKSLDSGMVRDLFTDEQSIMHQYSRTFVEADKYIIAAPMWNFSVPSILKSYVDHIIVNGVTYTYTEQGPKGLLADQHKKVIHISARGGIFSEGPNAAFEMGDRFLRAVMGFMGITDFQTLVIEGTNFLPSEQVEKNLKMKIEEAKKIANQF
ncbi:MAG: FMN-dependent NADH-azoreductase [Proteobacteria bacterium]|nr:FMN-dependent NADH-azoreductase [Pseudomonadota bacterium]